MPADDDTPPPSAQAEQLLEMAQGLQTLAESFGVVNEFVAGQKADLEAKGFSPTAAEQMAVMLYPQMMAMIIAGATK